MQNDEIKEILEELENMYEISELEEQVNNINKIKDYITNLEDTLIDKQECIDAYNEIINNRDKEITNLQQEIKEANDSITWWNNRFKALQRENERLKKALNCKEYFSSTMPEDTEFVILTKNNYDKQQKDIQLELIDYKLRIEKAIEYNNQIIKDTKDFYRPTTDIIYSGDTLIEIATNNINILQNGSDIQ